MFSSLQWLAWSYSCIRARMIVLILYIMITITAVHDHGQFDNSDWLGLSVIAIAPNLWKLSMSYSHPYRHPPTWSVLSKLINTHQYQYHYQLDQYSHKGDSVNPDKNYCHKKGPWNNVVWWRGWDNSWYRRFSALTIDWFALHCLH